MGRIAGMLSGVAVELTPLERRLAHFGHVIARWVAAIAVVLVVVGVGIEGISYFNQALLFAPFCVILRGSQSIKPTMCQTHNTNLQYMRNNMRCRKRHDR